MAQFAIKLHGGGTYLKWIFTAQPVPDSGSFTEDTIVFLVSDTQGSKLSVTHKAANSVTNKRITGRLKVTNFVT